MAEPLAQQLYYTKDEYLEMEAIAAYKSEYYSGEIFAMSGGTPAHSLICVNMIRRIAEAVDSKNCRCFESNMKLEIPAADAFVYPDIMLVCGEIRLAENTRDVITNPVLIIEVLSPGTESFDRGKKFEYYRSIPSLKEYVLVSQEKQIVEIYFRQNRGTWLYTVAQGLDKTILLNSIEYEIALKEIYHKVTSDR
jgi:Uma2 family endonuclease